MDYIVLSIPLFFILIGLEVVVSALKKSELYRFNDAVTNISCGITQQVIGALFKTVLLVGYLYIYKHWSFWDIPNYWIIWIILFVSIDFCYYWLHRSTHEVNLFWGAHIVHHQSEEYNLSVALRQSSLQSTLYQFWIHTKTIDKMPVWFEYIFNTPSHHRVHHGRNPKYIDRNHGGTLIIFDRLFGTFQAEEEEVVYGVTKNLNSWNPVWANLDYYVDLWSEFKLMPTWGDRIKLLIHKPGWRPEVMGGPKSVPEISAQDTTKYDTKISLPINYYVLVQYALILAFGSLFLLKLDGMMWTEKIIGTILIIGSVTSMGIILENKLWIKWGEVARLIALSVIVCLWSSTTIIWILVIGMSTLSLIYFHIYYRPMQVIAKS
ncbi:UNVERIFIED_CONTAM: hypothetical protein GTU68_010450 [Idotea baltica]|nr:hypothetical protein [Idotea baltica]